MIVSELRFPVDDDGFFRRECPLCQREFKIAIKPEELNSLIAQIERNYLLTTAQDHIAAEQQEEPLPDYFCPYCGQQSSATSWWTQEQIAYIHVVMNNIIAQSINEHLIRPLQRSFNGSQSSGSMLTFRFEGHEQPQHEEWISPEINDMSAVDLPCCQRQLKIVDGWNGPVHCFFCGFPYQHEDAGQFRNAEAQ